MQKFKFVLVGDQSVGKTSIIARFINNTFSETYQATIGIDFLSKTVYLEDKTIRVQLWDTAGQERFRSLIPSYIRDSSVAILVYSIVERSSFENLTRWIDDVITERGQAAKLHIFGNKCDLVDNRKVSFQEGETLATKYNATFREVSAKCDIGIATAFKSIAKDVANGVEPNPRAIREPLAVTELAPDVPQRNSCAC